MKTEMLFALGLWVCAATCVLALSVVFHLFNWLVSERAGYMAALISLPFCMGLGQWAVKSVWKE